MSTIAGFVLWTSVPYLLLDRRIAWRRLLPGGAVAGIAVSLYGAATSVYMSRLMTAYSARYGVFGVTVALVGWLLCICFIVVAATVVAAELDRAPEDWAQRLRTKLGADAPRPEALDRAAGGTQPE
jgi:membrane protein